MSIEAKVMNTVSSVGTVYSVFISLPDVSGVLRKRANMKRRNASLELNAEYEQEIHHDQFEKPIDKIENTRLLHESVNILCDLQSLTKDSALRGHLRVGHNMHVRSLKLSVAALASGPLTSLTGNSANILSRNVFQLIPFMLWFTTLWLRIRSYQEQQRWFCLMQSSRQRLTMLMYRSLGSTPMRLKKKFRHPDEVFFASASNVATDHSASFTFAS